MLKVEGNFYYSCNEIANALNNPDVKRPIEAELKSEWNKFMNRSADCYTTMSYVQSKLYSAVKNQQIKHLKYKKSNSGKTFVAFTIQDVLDYLHEFNFPKTKGFEKITEIQIVEAKKCTTLN